MKKIKLFALAVFAMLSANAFADKSATTVFTFEYTSETATTCVITGFVADLADELKAGVVIPEYVTHPTLKEGGKAKTFQVEAIAAGAFEGQPIQTIAFPEVNPETEYEGIKSIGDGAFTGTKIKSFDLSSTVIENVGNIFGTKIDGDDPKKDVVNATLTSVKFPATVTTIYNNAFANCTKLATVDMTAAVDLTSIGAGAFAGCPIKDLDLSKNVKITYLTNKVLYDGKRFTAAQGVETVKLHKAFSDLNNNLTGCTTLKSVTGHIYVTPSKKEETKMKDLNEDEFKGCTALTTFETKYIETFNDGCFDGCASFATANLEKATYLGERAFAGTALKSVTIPNNDGLIAIGDQAFFECASLTTATLKMSSGSSKITYVGEQAFAYTGITSFTVPEKNADFYVDSKAFAGTPIKTFTWMATSYDDADLYIPEDVFSKCKDVVFATTDDFVADWQSYYSPAKAPTNSKFSTEEKNPNIPFTTAAYSTNPNKFYVKWYDTDPKGEGYYGIRVKRSDCKVYAGYLDGDGSLAMIQYKADDKGMITIDNNDAALIITNNKDLTYVKDFDGYGSTSWMTTSSASYLSDETLLSGQNALKYCTDATTRGTLENQLSDDSYYIYGWMKAGGFQKIATGTTIPQGTLFAFAKEPVKGARMTIKWYDENGNLEAETTAIDAIQTVGEKAEGKTFNLAGQEVNASYKGVIIKDGKKVIRKK